MKKLALPIAVVAALMFVSLDADTADAGGFRISLGGHGVHAGFGGGHCGFAPWYYNSYQVWYPGYYDPYCDHWNWHHGGWRGLKSRRLW